MLYKVAFRHLAFVLLLSLVLDGLEAKADLEVQSLNNSLIAVNVYRNKDKSIVTGLVVQADRYNGYLLSNAAPLKNSDSLSVSASGSGSELVAQIVVMDETRDLALLKVNGLNLPALPFALESPTAGDVVWSAVRWDAAEQAVGLARGNVHKLEPYQESSDTRVITHSAVGVTAANGSVLLNDCGEVVGFNTRSKAPSTGSRAIEASALVGFVGRQNVKVTRAVKSCVSALSVAKEKAELATRVAAQAKADATDAQRLAQAMEAQLRASDQRSQRLAEEAASARVAAEAAIKTAEQARKHADETRVDLEKQTASIVAETEAMLAHLQEDREAAEARFQSALAAQRESAVAREDFLIVAFMVLIVSLMVIFFVLQRLGIRPAEIVQAVQSRDISILKPKTVMHKPALDEYVLDGRDDDGIRYLLRISGDQLSGDNGIVIGRNPNESPYTINHSDVSRQHARLKVMKNRVFIEDLGSTNGTSVNGQNIDDKGPVSVSNGDQIIIGSVVMKLKVMGA